MNGPCSSVRRRLGTPHRHVARLIKPVIPSGVEEPNAHAGSGGAEPFARSSSAPPLPAEIGGSSTPLRSARNDSTFPDAPLCPMRTHHLRAYLDAIRNCSQRCNSPFREPGLSRLPRSRTGAPRRVSTPAARSGISACVGGSLEVPVWGSSPCGCGAVPALVSTGCAADTSSVDAGGGSRGLPSAGETHRSDGHGWP